MMGFRTIRPVLLSVCAAVWVGGVALPADANSGGLAGRTILGCGDCHSNTVATAGFGNLTFSSQPLSDVILNDLTLKRDVVYSLRVRNNLGGSGGFNLGDVGVSSAFSGPSNARVVAGEVVHINRNSSSWTFGWQPTSVGSGTFQWCSQRVDGNLAADAGDGPHGCGTQNFTVEENSPPEITAQPTYVFLESSSLASRVITIDVIDANTGDEEGLTYVWSPAIGLANATVQDPRFTATASQTYSVTAKDEIAQMNLVGGEGTFSNIVVDIDPRPIGVISNVPTTPVREGTALSIAGTGSTDQSTTAGAPVPPAEYRWSLRNQLNVVVETGANPIFSFTVPDINAGQTQTFSIELTVVDNNQQESVLVSEPLLFEDAAVGDSPPNILAIEASGVNEGEVITLTATISEAIADTDAVWAQVSGAPVVTLNGSGALSRTFVTDIANSSTPGPLLGFNLTVTDSVNQTTNRNVEVQINNGPTASAGTDQFAAEGAQVTLDGTGSFDPDSASVARQWTQLAGPMVTLDDSSAESPSFSAASVPPAGVELEFQLSITDTEGLNDTDSVLVTVNNENVAPTANAGAVQAVAEGATVTLNGSGTVDDEVATLTYSWTQTGGTAVSLDDATAVMPMFVAPALGFDGDPLLTFSLLVTDADNQTSTDVTMVNVNNENNAPVANAGVMQSVEEGMSVVLDGSGSTDADLANDDVLTFLWEQVSGTPLPDLINPTTATPTLTAPFVEPAGQTATFRLTVTDRGGLMDTAETIVNIINLNQPPVANAAADQTVSAGDLVELDATASSDPDAPISGFIWSQLSGPPAVLSDPSAGAPTFIAPPAGSEDIILTWRVVVTGNEGLQAQDDVQVTIAPSDAVPPVANAGADQLVDAGSTIQLDGSGSEDTSGAGLTYAWRVLGNQFLAVQDAMSVSASLVAPTADGLGELLTVELMVTNAAGLSSTDTLVITIRESGDLNPPLVSILPSARTVMVGADATVFATMINPTSSDFTGCTIVRDTPFAGNFTYQTTDPSTNQLTGTANSVVTIPAGGLQTFVLGIVPTSPFPSIELSFVFDCANTPRAVSISGLSTLMLGASEVPVADVIALSATTSRDGVLRIPAAGSAAFGVANFNLGATAILRVEVDAPVGLPIGLTVCETITATAACIAPPADMVNTNAFSNGSASFSIFATASGDIPFSPAESRIRLRFMEGDVVRGSTSVAITTQ